MKGRGREEWEGRLAREGVGWEQVRMEAKGSMTEVEMQTPGLGRFSE